ncbi:hypothetical protein [Eubacterium sp. AB3007]|uniref:hypothetical protein n=1 Tax=Eubacterium sp. AB3007 TaxID=1392487 RepID=UPI0004828805|nr:hypothetical protein [Eubacterium sp. AB3007]
MKNPGSRNRFPQNRIFSTSAEEIPCPVPQTDEKSRIAEQIPVKQNFFHVSGRNSLSCSAKRRKKPYRGTDSRKTEFFPLQRKKFPVLFRKPMKNPGSRNRFPQNRGFSTSAEEIPCPVPQTDEKSRIAEQIPAKQRFFHFSGRNSLSCSAKRRKKRIAEQIPAKQNFFHFSGRNSLSCSAN